MGALDLSPEAIGRAAARIMSRCAELRAISADPERYERLYLTLEHRAAADRLQGWLTEAGLSVRLDAVGNVIGRIDSWNPQAPALILASHFDTVRDAGAYDGQLGVVAAIEAAGALRSNGVDLPFPIEVHAYADEEGTRFHSMLLTSSFVTGLDGPEMLTVAAADGVSMGDAMQAFGLRPEAIGEARRQRGEFRAYLELHIEQGPVLEAEDLPVGTVTNIAGQTRGTITVEGVAGHAGTVPMELRRDALAGAAQAVLAIEEVGRSEQDPHLVTTVGELRVQPGASNVIPGKVEFTLDLRSGNDGERQDALERIREQLDAIATDRNLAIGLQVVCEMPAVQCDHGLIAAIDAASEAVQGFPIHLTSGAGHDAITMSTLCPVGMVFVRCKDGISHNPAESVTEADVGAGFATLLRTIATLIERP